MLYLTRCWYFHTSFNNPHFNSTLPYLSSVLLPVCLFDFTSCTALSHWGLYCAITVIHPDICCCVTKAALDGWPPRPAAVEGSAEKGPRHYDQTLALTVVARRQGTTLLSFVQPSTDMTQSGALATGRVKREREEEVQVQPRPQQRVSAVVYIHVCTDLCKSAFSFISYDKQHVFWGHWDLVHSSLGPSECYPVMDKQKNIMPPAQAVTKTNACKFLRCD